jgi:hypothetical protein
MISYRYDKCIVQYREEAAAFIKGYLASNERRVLLIAGAGFDPRSVMVGNALADAGCTTQAILVREERPTPSGELLSRAELNVAHLCDRIKDHQVIHIQIFAPAPDRAVIGGREAAKVAAQVNFDGLTDIVVDCSALSKGVFFPLIRHLSERLTREAPKINLHLFVIHEPETDTLISSTAGTAEPMHGFRGDLGLSSSNGAARLWIPQLISNQHAVLERIYTSALVGPHDICPILPFPSSNPRKGDELIEEYMEELESAWQVDPRNLIYASEDGPLDIYRTLIRLDASRSRVFEQHGGSLMILSPVGSKVTALGILMAAMERGFPVVYVEAESYQVNFAQLNQQRDHCGDMVHIWLQGEAYIVADQASTTSVKALPLAV